VACISLAIAISAAPIAASANEIDYWTGEAENVGDSTYIHAEGHGSGPGADAPTTSDSTDEPTTFEVGEDGEIELSPSDLAAQSDFCSPANVGVGDCAGNPTTPPEEPEAPIVVTLRDIASFRPATPGNGMEPGGWAIEGLPANFVAAASVEVVSGTLLGQPADVRFTPVGYRWGHSDGAAVESGAPGATWATLWQREFTPTSTSHVYTTAGEYMVELAVLLRAEYRFGGSAWRSIAGTLTIAGEPQRVLVGEVDTVLTQGDCKANPSGPGC
jgi:hypothetical protein